MGFSGKAHVGDGEEERKWVLAGMSTLNQIRTKAWESDSGGGDEEEGCFKTPTAKDARTLERFPCPPAPRKRRPAPVRHVINAPREFFTIPPPDLESLFRS